MKPLLLATTTASQPHVLKDHVGIILQLGLLHGGWSMAPQVQ